MKIELINPINESYTPLEQVLTNRGFALEDIQPYLSAVNRSQEFNYDFSLFKYIDTAVQLILKHLSLEGNLIYVQVDPDCDGFGSSAILLNYLHRVFPSCIEKIRYDFHSGKQHGIELALIPDGTTLVIAPDSSSNDYEIHETLAKKNIDVLVLDHHEADQVSEYACVINNQLCDYPNKTLSGAGVVYKLCQAMDKMFNVSYADYFLDLVALCEVGDMMDIRNLETRYLISRGFDHVINPFIAGMEEKQSYSLGDELTPIGVAFYIVPLVNAICRVGTQAEKRLIFDSMLEWKAYNLVPSTKRGCSGQEETLLSQSLRTCTNVKNRQTKAQDTAVEIIENLIAATGLADHQILMVCLDEQHKIDPSVTGLIANKLMAKYQRPTLLLNKREEDGEIIFAGSARGYDKGELKDFRKFVSESELSLLAQGHAQAFGAAFTQENAQKFLEYADEKLAGTSIEPCYMVDYNCRPQELSPNIILDLGDHKELWGQNVAEPLIAIDGLNVTKEMITLMSRDKKPTLKIELPNGICCIKFRSSEEEFENLYSENGCVTINLVGKPNVNEWNYTKTPQLLISDYEVINRQEFYF